MIIYEIYACGESFMSYQDMYDSLSGAINKAEKLLKRSQDTESVTIYRTVVGNGAKVIKSYTIKREDL